MNRNGIHTEQADQVLRSVDIDGALIGQVPGGSLELLAQPTVLGALVAVEKDLVQTLVEVLLNPGNHFLQHVLVCRRARPLWKFFLMPVLQDLADWVLRRQRDHALVLGYLLPIIDKQGLQVVWHDNADRGAEVETLLLLSIVSMGS